MKVLTASAMRKVDQQTIELGLPGIVLMENAAHRVVEEMVQFFGPLAPNRIVVLCGKGNNGGDGLAIARLLFVRHGALSLDVVLFEDPAQLRGDALANLRMLEAAGVACLRQIPNRAVLATIVVDAVLGTGIIGSARGGAFDAIEAINSAFPLAKVVAVDLPSGMSSDAGSQDGLIARADVTVTFTAPKLCHVMPPNCNRLGKLVVVPIGSPEHLLESDIHIAEAIEFHSLFGQRPRGAYKGNFGHVLLVGGTTGKSGAIKMAGLAALRAGAGLVTVASQSSELSAELMTHPLTEAEVALDGKTVLAAGPGLGTSPEAAHLLERLLEKPAPITVLDADALTLLSATSWKATAATVLTPHPGEMSRLLRCTIAEVELDRIAAVKRCAQERNAIVVLKGERSLIATPAGLVFINPTGSPALAKAGSGDILTGLVAGLLAQFPDDVLLATRAAVYLHGLAGDLGAAAIGEKCLLATDLLGFLGEAMRVLHPL